MSLFSKILSDIPDKIMTLIARVTEPVVSRAKESIIKDPSILTDEIKTNWQRYHSVFSNKLTDRKGFYQPFIDDAVEGITKQLGNSTSINIDRIVGDEYIKARDNFLIKKFGISENGYFEALIKHKDVEMLSPDKPEDHLQLRAEIKGHFLPPEQKKFYSATVNHWEGNNVQPVRIGINGSRHAIQSMYAEVFHLSLSTALNKAENIAPSQSRQ